MQALSCLKTDMFCDLETQYVYIMFCILVVELFYNKNTEHIRVVQNNAYYFSRQKKSVRGKIIKLLSFKKNHQTKLFCKIMFLRRNNELNVPVWPATAGYFPLYSNVMQNSIFCQQALLGFNDILCKISNGLFYFQECQNGETEIIQLIKIKVKNYQSEPTNYESLLGKYLISIPCYINYSNVLLLFRYTQ